MYHCQLHFYSRVGGGLEVAEEAYGPESRAKKQVKTFARFMHRPLLKVMSIAPTYLCHMSQRGRVGVHLGFAQATYRNPSTNSAVSDAFRSGIRVPKSVSYACHKTRLAFAVWSVGRSVSDCSCRMYAGMSPATSAPLRPWRMEAESEAAQRQRE